MKTGLGRIIENHAERLESQRKAGMALARGQKAKNAQRGVRNAELESPLTPALSPGRGEGGAEEYLTKIEVARRMKKSVRAVEEWMRARRIPYYKLDQAVRFRWSEVQGYFAKNCRVAAVESTINEMKEAK